MLVYQKGWDALKVLQNEPSCCPIDNDTLLAPSFQINSDVYNAVSVLMSEYNITQIRTDKNERCVIIKLIDEWLSYKKDWTAYDAAKFYKIQMNNLYDQTYNMTIKRLSNSELNTELIQHNLSLICNR